MNYIKRLESENETARAEIEARDAAIAELRRYLLSDKFHTDTTVQVRDVLHRIDSALHFEKQSRGL